MIHLESYPNSESRKRTSLHDRMLFSLTEMNFDEIIRMLNQASPEFAVLPNEKTAGGRSVRFLLDHENKVSFFPKKHSVSLGVPVSTDKYSQSKYWSMDAVISFAGHYDRNNYFDPGEFCIICEVKTEIQSLSELLDQANKYRSHFLHHRDGRMLIICPKMEPWEQKTLTSQGFLVFTKGRNIEEDKPLCVQCNTTACPLQGNSFVSVRACGDFNLLTHLNKPLLQY